MSDRQVTAVPAEYFTPVGEDLQGTIQEVSYPVGHYINESRQLVAGEAIDSREAGRETVKGEAIRKSCNVYLPAGYDPDDKAVKYNVLYLLHGVGGNQYEWLSDNGSVGERYKVCNLFDRLIAGGDIDPLIVVFPNGRSAHDWTDRTFRTEGTHMLGFYYFDYELKYDLIPFIESTYNTRANVKDATTEGVRLNRESRAIAGLSMGGMQALNLIVGGYRYDSTKFTGTESVWDNGLAQTVLAPGMIDMFGYVGAFSNAPTSSDGRTLGTSLAASANSLHSLFISCGDADEIAVRSYAGSTEGLPQRAGDRLGRYYEVLIQGGLHDFEVWNNGAYNFSRLAFGNRDAQAAQKVVRVTL
ncbi:alpha/beta hydrolase [Cohnella panacarvi]|uniref:alpha/beta hydrolase n=1 Tax=Cohnella panacarvi TaxID=400776 RepID=UPI00047E1CBC|nr:alpha/beta hydrolase-fold protein [Cohnella panacarvi]